LSVEAKNKTDVKQTVLDFYELAFVQRKPEEAARDLMGDNYTQHNPDVPDGKDAFVGVITGLFSQFPDFSTEKKRVIAEDDLVVIHHHIKMTKDDRGSSVADIFRVEDGKVVEHWDIIQQCPESPANSNTMF
jgi:predicted SnoaL-like aldol condensation-catalyzing enzyme